MIKLTNFSKRHFEKSFKGTKILDITPVEFEEILNTKECKMLDGYADFCKLMVVKNFTSAKTGTVSIGQVSNRNIHSIYESRTEEELPVLTTYVNLRSESVPTAEYLVVVLYSHAQLVAEHDPTQLFELGKGDEYGIVAILGQMSDKEEPMKPSTMIRNAMGILFGGSGEPLDKEKYLESVKFWEYNYTVNII